ncbi:hypothetical protein [Parvularcula lutaonensis]|uniref:Uncharacterized protein n=1 Tax=Parvularcula lutaonensis TaxID=491923 RepID=A0ABV7M997_9PROT|nr:hypothetical protein [Parvularcula lutaonensis]GGY44790.1 hypothetical protein GCM10007148_12150 [Parvularcula lutaonensis]
MTKIAQATAATLALFAAAGIAHAGSLNDDINNCRAAIVEAGLLGDAEFNLDFVDDKGNRNRVLTLEANVVGGEDVIIECRMSRSKIKEVVIASAE